MPYLLLTRVSVLYAVPDTMTRVAVPATMTRVAVLYAVPALEEPKGTTNQKRQNLNQTKPKGKYCFHQYYVKS